MWNQLEFSKNRSSVSYFFVYWKPVSLHVLVFLVEYELVNVDCIVISIKLLSTFVLLWVCCIFSKHLFIRTPMERCFCIASHISFSWSSQENVWKKSATKGNSKAAGCMAAHLLKTTSLHVLLRSFTNNLSFLYTLLKFQKQPPEVLCEKFVLRNFAKFIGKHLCQRLFFNKVAGQLY